MKRTATAVLLALVFAGCGGSSSKPLTHAELVARANAACAERNRQIAALPRSLATPQSITDLATYLKDTINIVGPLLTKLEKLMPPASDKATWDQALADNRKDLQLAEQAEAAAAAGNATEVQRLAAQGELLSARIRAEASQLGLTVCNAAAHPNA